MIKIDAHVIILQYRVTKSIDVDLFVLKLLGAGGGLWVINRCARCDVNLKINLARPYSKTPGLAFIIDFLPNFLMIKFILRSYQYPTFSLKSTSE